jgi:hypothetical protein
MNRFYRWKRTELETEWFENAGKVQKKVGFMNLEAEVPPPEGPTFSCPFCGEDV